MTIPFTITAFFLLMVNAFSQNLDLARQSHPLNPSDTNHTESTYTESELIPAKGYNSLIKQEAWLRSQLERFPSSSSKASPPQRKFGILCHLNPEDLDRPKEAWIELTLNQTENLKLEAIALIPALYHNHSTDSNYGFPKRFKIQGFSLEHPESPITLVDWTTQDFPDPGLSPVIFRAPDSPINRIKITVTEGHPDSDKEFFALDELLVFRNGINIAPPVINLLKCSNSYNIAPYWHRKYLVDNHSHIGKSLAGETTDAAKTLNDFIYYPPKKKNPKNKDTTITIDLGKQYSIGRVELHTAQDPHSHTPSIPLPYIYQLQLLTSIKPDKITSSKNIQRSDQDQVRFHPLQSLSGRYVRLSFTKLPVHNGRPVLALGEIRVIGDNGKNQDMLELNKKVFISPNLAEPLNPTDTSLLVDGSTNGLNITSEKTYIEQLAKRNIVEKAYQKISKQIPIAKAIRSERYWTIVISLAILSLIFFIYLFVKMKKQKQLEMLALQKQIAADLHDDISGNLGTISMISNRINKLTQETKIKDKLREIDHLSQESYISVKEIIWHTDSEIVRLSDLLKQIQRTATSISNDCKLTYEFPNAHDDYEDIEVPVNTRRNIILLVKESLFNCAKYAQANNILIKADITASVFTISMRDDGCGFDFSKGILTNSESGRGLLNMEQRAKLLGADLSIKSALNEGTEIKLKMPLSPSK